MCSLAVDGSVQDDQLLYVYEMHNVCVCVCGCVCVCVYVCACLCVCTNYIVHTQRTFSKVAKK